MTAGTQIAYNRPFRVFNVDFSDFANNYNFRFSTRYHNEITKKLTNILSGVKTRKMKEIVETIEKGV